MKNIEAATNLRVALELLEQHGVGVEAYVNSRGQYCAMGAIYAARTGKRGEEVAALASDIELDEITQQGITWPETEALTRAMFGKSYAKKLNKLGGIGLDDIFAFNDFQADERFATTPDDEMREDWGGPEAVIEAFRKAIEIVEAE